MPKPGTDLQAEFVANMVAGGMNATRAAIAAGYSPRSAKVTAHNLLKKPHVQDAIRAEQRRVLQSDMATRALVVLRNIMEDEEAPAGARVDAAKTVLDRAGLVAPRVAVGGDDNLPLTQMNVADLRKVIASGEQEVERLQRELDALAIEGEALPAD